MLARIHVLFICDAPSALRMRRSGQVWAEEVSQSQSRRQEPSRGEYGAMLQERSDQEENRWFEQNMPEYTHSEALVLSKISPHVLDQY